MENQLMVQGDRFKIIGNNQKGTVLKRIATYRNEKQHYMVKMDNQSMYPKIICINGKQMEPLNDK